MAIIPATSEAGEGGWQPGQPGQPSETLSQKKKGASAWLWVLASVFQKRGVWTPWQRERLAGVHTARARLLGTAEGVQLVWLACCREPH